MNEQSSDITAARPPRTRRRIWYFAAFAVLVAVGVVAAVYAGQRPLGEELATGTASGWYAAKDVGTTFTDGLNIITVTPQARGPLRLISARPLMDDGKTLRVVGVLARVIPRMLPPNSTSGGLQQSPGFPPTLPDAAGGVPVEGLVVQPPEQGEDLWIEIQIGYEVMAPGRSTRHGVELVYEYEGTERKAVIPSYLAICAPATVACDPEYDE
ncbi:hypothetical protein AB0B66_37985 [Catellatospora sp. NPDC049111]|uniref:hypothetical protein n=1 Tax=Catellatospora sp. NPDC049111 TaxID=3155271 RepID=UPI00340F4453